MTRHLLLAATILITASAGLASAQVPPEVGDGRVQLERLKREAREFAATGDISQAIRHAEAARDLARRLYGPDHGQHAATLHLLGSMYVRGGRPAAAVETFTRALGVLDGLDPPDHMGSLAVATALADLYLRSGETERVARLCERALAAGAQSREAGARPWMARAGYLLGEARVAQGRLGDAERAYRGALRRFAAVGGSESRDARQCLAALARLRELRDRQKPPGLVARLGVTVLPRTETGFPVEAVLPDSPAARAGLWPGDVIISHGDFTFREPGLGSDALRKAVDAAPADTPILLWVSRRAAFIRLEVRYGDGAASVPVTLSDQQRTLLAEFGHPDTFTISCCSSGDQKGEPLVRHETWFYHELRTSFGFIDGVFANSREIAGLEECDFPKWKPEAFRGGMSVAEARAVLGDVEVVSVDLKELKLGDPDLENLSLYCAPQLVLGFADGVLCLVMSLPGESNRLREESR